MSEHYTKAREMPPFNDPSVQRVYEILCEDNAPPDGEHWEGFAARRIVAALAPIAAEPQITERESLWLTLSEEMHPRTRNLVVRFARALAKKLRDAEKKYGYTDGWLDPDWMDECRAKLLEHVAKGDPRDVAAYCAFLWHHGASTAAPIAAEPAQPDWQHLKPYGYAPGHYMVTCADCGEQKIDLDKRALHCRPCAEKLFAAAQPGAEA